MILLDTNALIWLDNGHRRARSLPRGRRLFLSPASLLEVQFLVELGKLRLQHDALARLTADARWTVDDPPAVDWFERAWGLSWTHDPFDRLIVAHARLRGWRLATGDSLVIDRLDPGECIAL